MVFSESRQRVGIRSGQERITAQGLKLIVLFSAFAPEAKYKLL